MQNLVVFPAQQLDFDESNKATVQLTNNSECAVKIRFRINNPPSGRIVSGPDQEQVIKGGSSKLEILDSVEPGDTETELKTLQCKYAFPKLSTEEFAMQEYHSNKNYNLHLATAALSMFFVGFLLSSNHRPISQ